MRFLLLAAFLALLATVCAEKDYMLVRRRDRDITQAINLFCGYTEDMVSLPPQPSLSLAYIPFFNQNNKLTFFVS
jgi:hypothetical protein